MHRVENRFRKNGITGSIIPCSKRGEDIFSCMKRGNEERVFRQVSQYSSKKRLSQVNYKEFFFCILFTAFKHKLVYVETLSVYDVHTAQSTSGPRCRTKKRNFRPKTNIPLSPPTTISCYINTTLTNNVSMLLRVRRGS
jgi:hypothetical protein